MNDIVKVDNNNQISNSKNDLLIQISNLENSQSFINEVNLINDEIIELERLYKNIETDLNKYMNTDNDNNNKPTRLGVKPNNPPRKNPLFVSSQTSNLISMRNLKLQLLKEQTRIKEQILERQIKLLNMKTRIENADTAGGSEEKHKEFLKYILEHTQIGKTDFNGFGKENIKDIIEGELVDDELERRLEEDEEVIIDKSNESITNNDNDEGYFLYGYLIDGVNNKIVIQEGTCRLFIINNEYEILKELDVEEVDIVEEEENFLIDKFSRTEVEIIEEFEEE